MLLLTLRMCPKFSRYNFLSVFEIWLVKEKYMLKRYYKLPSLPYTYLDRIWAKCLPHCCMQSSSSEQYLPTPTTGRPSPHLNSQGMNRTGMFPVLMGSLSASKDNSKFTRLSTSAPWEEQNLCWYFQLQELHIRPEAQKQWPLGNAHCPPSKWKSGRHSL